MWYTIFKDRKSYFDNFDSPVGQFSIYNYLIVYRDEFDVEKGTCESKYLFLYIETKDNQSSLRQKNFSWI